MKRSNTPSKAPLSFTPTGNAAGGEAPVKSGPNATLMQIGILILAAGDSWSVYYFLRPPKD